MKRAKTGDIFRFPLGDGRFGYGKCVWFYERIYDLVDGGNTNADEVAKVPYAFSIAISKGNMLRDLIERIGNTPTNEAEILEVGPFYKFTPERREFRLQFPARNEYPIATHSACIGLVESVSYEFEQMVEILKYHVDQTISWGSLCGGPLRADFNIFKYHENRPNARVGKKPEDYLNYVMPEGK